MDFVLYRARGKNGYLYDISLEPDIDFTILKSTRRIDRFEILSEKASLNDCKKALDKIYSKPPFIIKFIAPGEYFINSTLKKYNIKRAAGKIDNHEVILNPSDVSKIENCITGRVVSLNQLLSFDKKYGMSCENIIKAVQALYCMRRIKIMPAIRKEKNKVLCSLCEKEPCLECCYGFKEDDILLYAADNYRLNDPHNVIAKKTKLPRILKNAEEAVNEFILSKKNSAVVWCTSNAFDYGILGSGAASCLSVGKNILYITADSFTYEVRQKLNEDFEGAVIDITDGYDPDYSELDIAICSYNSLPCYHKAFDVVIMDLRYLYLDTPAKNIYYRSIKAMKEKGKILYVTSNLENLKNKFTTGHPEMIPIPLPPSLKPVPEPRIVTSRFLGSSEWFLPPMVTEMIHWSINSGAGIIIFVPDENQMCRLYSYLTNSEDFKSITIGTSSVDDKTQLFSMQKGESNIIISSDIRDTLQNIDNINIVVLYGNGKSFTADALINMSAMAVWHTGHSQGEVVFVANQEDESMSLAKNAIRSINKVAWERGYMSR